MTFNILKSWNPYVHNTLKSLRGQYTVVARDYESDSKEERRADIIQRDRIRADYHSKFFQQFMHAGDFEAYLASKANSNGYDLETVVAQEVAEARRLRNAMPFGEISAKSGPLFAENSDVISRIYNFSRLKAPELREKAEWSHTDVLVFREKTKNSFNVCLVATRNNTVLEDAADMGHEIWQRCDRSLFRKKPLNVLMYMPAEESSLPGTPDRLKLIIEDGKALSTPTFFDRIPRRIVSKWGNLAPYFDYKDVGDLHTHYEAPPSANVASHRAYRDFVLGS